MNPEHIPLVAIAVAGSLLILKNRKPRTLRPQWMWVVPLMIVVLIGLGLWGLSMSGDHVPFRPLDWSVMALALVLGGVLGWQRGRMTTIRKEADGTLKAQASPIGLILILLLLAGRQALRPWLETHAGNWHLNPLALQDAFMLFAVGLVVIQRVEMWIRARRVQAGEADAHVLVT